MKISCFPNTYGRFGPHAAIDLLGAAGIRWIELPIKNYGVPSFFKEEPVVTDGSAPAAIFALKERIAESGLGVSSCNISSGNPLQEDVLARTLKKLSIAGQFNVSLVVAGGGELDSEDDWPQLVRNMRQIGDQAAELGITYCCETHPGVCQNALKMQEFIERVNHEQIRINFDTGNLYYYNEHIDFSEEFKRVAEWICHVHLKDTNGKFKDWHFPALGAGGQIDFSELYAFLTEIDFVGPCSLELEGIEGEPELSLPETQQRVVASIEHLRQSGWKLE